METLGMTSLPHFGVGGTLHLVVNNQLGFTAPQDHGRCVCTTEFILLLCVCVCALYAEYAVFVHTYIKILCELCVVLCCVVLCCVFIIDLKVFSLLY